MSGISFKIKSSKETPVISQGDENDNEKEIVFSIEGNKIKSTKPEEVKRPLEIPLIKNQWNIRVKETFKTEIKDQESGELTLDQLAAKEILEDCRIKDENGETKESTQIIPLNNQNKQILGLKGDEKLDLSKHPDNPTQENYDQIPVSEFGLAMIRGMGWKPDEGIGLTNKKCVKPHELKPRPHGIGLGFNISLNPQGKAGNNTNKEDELVKGSYVYILEGMHKGLYGQVENFDEDTKAIVKLTLTNESIHIPEDLIKVVSPSEYKKESKILNKNTYDEYKSKQDKDSKKRGKPQDPFEDYKKESDSGHKHKHKKVEKEEESTKEYSRALPKWQA